MNTNSEILSDIFEKDVLSANKKSLENLDFYKKTSALIERTKIALGKKNTFKETSLSTLNTQINTNAIKSTQKI